jgi:hypothetical protein
MKTNKAAKNEDKEYEVLKKFIIFDTIVFFIIFIITIFVR